MKPRHLALLLSTFYFLLLLPSCQTLDPNADPVVVNAERDTQLATDTFTLIATAEQQARPTLAALDYKAAIQIKHGVDFIRVNSPKWLETARVVTRAYKSNRSSANKANLDTAIATLTAGLADAQKYLTQINSIQQKPAP